MLREYSFYNFNFFNLNFFDFFDFFFNYFFFKNNNFFLFNFVYCLYNLLKQKNYFEIINFNFINILINKLYINNNFFKLFFISFFNIFFFIFFFIFFLKMFFNFFFGILEIKKENIFKKFLFFFFTYFKFFNEKLESTEESFLFFKFWFFFLFLFFTHFYFYNNFTNIFIFIEWSLPVFFGILIILESIWIFSSNIFIYLNGSKGRKNFFASLSEDLINFFILVVRIILQMIRGIICSLYHDFLKEIFIYYFFKIQYLNLIWSSIFNFNEINNFFFFCIIIIKLYYLIIIMTLASLLMFLQVLFLFLAIWLFCKCWFISTNFKINKIVNYLIYFKINIIKN